MERGFYGFLLARRELIITSVVVCVAQLALAIQFWPSAVALFNAFVGGVTFATAIHYWLLIRPLYSAKLRRIDEARAYAAMRSAFEVFRAEMEARGIKIVEENGGVYVEGTSAPLNTTKH